MVTYRHFPAPAVAAYGNPAPRADHLETPLNIYTAIMKAADHIECNPREFSFSSTDIPDGAGCGTPGCALGWIGFFAGALTRGKKGFKGISLVASSGFHPVGFPELGTDNPLLSISQPDFYVLMDEFDRDWRCGAAACARALRLYAEKYHGHEKPQPLSPPDWNAIAAKQSVATDARSEELAW